MAIYAMMRSNHGIMTLFENMWRAKATFVFHTVQAVSLEHNNGQASREALEARACGSIGRPYILETIL